MEDILLRVGGVAFLLFGAWLTHRLYRIYYTED